MMTAARAVESVPANKKQEILKTTAEAYAILRMCSTRDTTNKMAMGFFGALALLALGAATFNPALFGVPLAAIAGACVICAGCVALTAGDKASTEALLEFFSRKLPDDRRLTGESPRG